MFKKLVFIGLAVIVVSAPAHAELPDVDKLRRAKFERLTKESIELDQELSKLRARHIDLYLDRRSVRQKILAKEPSTPDILSPIPEQEPDSDSKESYVTAVEKLIYLREKKIAEEQKDLARDIHNVELNIFIDQEDANEKRMKKELAVEKAEKEQKKLALHNYEMSLFARIDKARTWLYSHPTNPVARALRDLADMTAKSWSGRVPTLVDGNICGPLLSLEFSRAIAVLSSTSAVSNGALLTAQEDLTAQFRLLADYCSKHVNALSGHVPTLNDRDIALNEIEAASLSAAMDATLLLGPAEATRIEGHPAKNVVLQYKMIMLGKSEKETKNSARTIQ